MRSINDALATITASGGGGPVIQGSSRVIWPRQPGMTHVVPIPVASRFLHNSTAGIDLRRRGRRNMERLVWARCNQSMRTCGNVWHLGTTCGNSWQLWKRLASLARNCVPHCRIARHAAVCLNRRARWVALRRSGTALCAGSMRRQPDAEIAWTCVTKARNLREARKFLSGGTGQLFRAGAAGSQKSGDCLAALFGYLVAMALDHFVDQAVRTQ